MRCVRACVRACVKQRLGDVGRFDPADIGLGQLGTLPAVNAVHIHILAAHPARGWNF